MAKNVTLLGASYSDVPAVDLPQTGGGTARFSDASVTTAIASDVAQGKIFLDAQGQPTAGTASGGGGGIEPNDVNFYDYDGTLLYAYSAADFANLSEMPANPTHTGLTAQGWNWTLADAKTYVATYKWLDIGQMYTTSDGKTRIYIEIPADAPADQMTFYVRFTQSVGRGVTVNWGDGSAEETFTGTSAANRSHTYAAVGKYTITLNVTSGTLRFVGTSSYAIYGSTGNGYNKNRIHKVEIGNSVTELGQYLFYYCQNLESVTLPKTITQEIGVYCFQYTPSLRHVTIPNQVPSIGNYLFSNSRVSSCSLPKSVNSIGTYIVHYSYHLDRIVIPPNVTSIGATAFYYTCLKKIVLPSGVTSIGSNGMTNSYNLSELWIYATTPPTWGGSSLLSNVPRPTVYVPYSADHSVLAAYQNDASWGTAPVNLKEMPA